ncbi:hypothetical protein JVU11DRAFT_3702 [Chiua virens]|nr:hypothetical protein JVU11DRAFT_3702 [Chiua virens]
MLSNAGHFPDACWGLIAATIAQLVPLYTLSPRFIISIRELHAHDLQGRRGSGIDTGFGLSALSTHGAVGEPMLLAVGVEGEIAENVEADGGQNDGTGDIEEVLREVGSAQLV